MTKNTVIKTFIDVPWCSYEDAHVPDEYLRIKVPLCCEMPRGNLIVIRVTSKSEKLVGDTLKLCHQICICRKNVLNGILLTIK